MGRPQEDRWHHSEHMPNCRASFLCQAVRAIPERQVRAMLQHMARLRQPQVFQEQDEEEEIVGEINRACFWNPPLLGLVVGATSR